MFKDLTTKQFEGVFSLVKINIKFSTIKKIINNGRKKRISNSRPRKTT